MGDECSPVDIEIGTISKCATKSREKISNLEEIVRKGEYYMRCNQCGKIIPKTNQNSINYYGTHMIVCGKHYMQYYKYGKFLDESPKSNNDSNEYEITNEGVWIYCFNRKNEPSGKFLIDIDDLEKVMTKKWRYWKNSFYTGNYQPIQIHTFLLNPQKGEVVDHINGNRADNRRCNLRVTIQQNNLLNKEILSNNTSGVAGVSWDKERKKWASEIRMNGIRCHLGRFDNIEDAVYARYIAEQKLFKEFRSTRNDKKILEYVDLCEKKEEINKYVNNKLQEKYSA